MTAHITPQIRGHIFQNGTICVRRSREKRGKHDSPAWILVCFCDTVFYKTIAELKHRANQHCGCEVEFPVSSQKIRRHRLEGKQFGLWEVICRSEYCGKRGATAYWICRCKCGNTRNVATQTLVGGTSKGCGVCERSNVLTGIRKRTSSDMYAYFDANIERAKVDRKLWRCRVYRDGWDKEEALVTPVMKSRRFSKA